MSSEKKILLKNIFSVGIIQISNYIFPLITIPIVSRIIGPDKFGVINFAASFVAYFTLIIGFGFDLTATRRVASDPLNEKNRNKVFSEVFSSQCFLLLFSVLIFIVCLFFVPQLKGEKEVAIYTFITCFATVMTQNWLFQAMQDLHKIAVLSLIGKIIFTIIVLSTIHMKSDYYWQPLALSISQIGIALISFFWSIKNYNLKLLRVSFKSCLNLLWDEKTFFFSLCVINIYTTTTIVVLGITNSSTDVGYYTAGQKLILIMQMIITIPLTQAIFPYIGKAFGDSFEKGIMVVQKIIPVVFVFTFVSGVLIFFLSPYFITIFYGNKFAPAIIICRILAFIPMIIALSTIIGIHVMINLKMDKIFFKITLIGAIFGMILNLSFVRYFGYVGAAITWFMTELFVFSSLLVMIHKNKIYVFNYKYFSLRYFWFSFIEIKSKFIRKNNVI